MDQPQPPNPLSTRFRGFLPVVVDVETTGLDPARHGLLEIGVVGLALHPSRGLHPDWEEQAAIVPHQGASIDDEALQINKTDLSAPRPHARNEADALRALVLRVRQAVRDAGCVRAILVGHNAAFDLAFLRAAIARCDVKRDPFHPFSTFDTCTLAGMAVGQTALAKACSYMNIPVDASRTHSAAYDAQITAQLFCAIVNTWDAAPNRLQVLPQDQEEENGLPQDGERPI